MTDKVCSSLDYTLRLGDNALLLGQQLGKCVTRAPELEEEMALANFALDYIGQARLFLSYAGQLEGAGRGEDELAFLRDTPQFRNVLLVEQPNGDFAHTIVRQFLFETFYLEQLAALARSGDKRLAEIAVRAGNEIRYHLRHARQWLVRLGDGTAESHARTQAAVDALWRFTGELFTADEVDREAAQAGIGPDPASLRSAWDESIDTAFSEAQLRRPDNDWMDKGGKAGRHSEHLGYLLAEMQFLQRAYPGASW